MRKIKAAGHGPIMQMPLDQKKLLTPKLSSASAVDFEMPGPAEMWPNGSGSTRVYLQF
jgi:hypothetical protein